MWTRLLPIVGAVALLGGCRSSQHAGSQMSYTRSGSTINVPVELDDYKIRMPDSIPAGDAVFSVKNVGSHRHTIRIKGHGVDQKLPEDLGAGQTGTMRLHLQPGVYKVTCPIGAHAARGMRMNLRVGDAGTK